MEYSKDFFILGTPISTDIGECHFIRLKDYPQFVNDLSQMVKSKSEIIAEFQENNKFGQLDSLINDFNASTLLDIVNVMDQLRASYQRVFAKVFNNPDAFQAVDEKNFYDIRKLILDMHCLKEKKVSKNSELEKFNKKSRALKQSENNYDFSDIVSCVVQFTGYSSAEVLELTLPQLHSHFFRGAAFLNSSAAIVLSTVSPEAAKNIGSWSQHIDLFEEEKNYITKKEARNLEKLFSN
ncbi:MULTISPECIES: hypothetical protein [Bacillus]|uniref:Uncharacterized protein n=1 Tax=Bacillus velezensis TaxID=492670 RepID=A0A411A4R4_BACVE|nr:MULTISPECIES: hypothetical protein [Bacillus]APA02230.1 hypothetical protein BK055_06655 [Bacillus velezensis]ARW38436.1 SPBc2 prophage-derived uncharacterized protein YomV [Bacillus amyloliquefaciens]ASB64854.1 SPBc2 prophage-derived uncharacterized protein YomV [Bacillus velezensis]AXS60298.1 hypothetical protein CK238_06315 [Bacillus velezensis]MCG1016591.1 hypothetical protein [Bacillus velezensis]